MSTGHSDLSNSSVGSLFSADLRFVSLTAEANYASTQQSLSLGDQWPAISLGIDCCLGKKTLLTKIQSYLICGYKQIFRRQFWQHEHLAKQYQQVLH